MAPNKRHKGSVRRSQLITTYGVGSVVALKEGSFMIAGLEHWDVGDPNIHEPRLERQLGVHGFVLPPATEGGGNDVPVVRFPTYYSCPECKRLDRHNFFCGAFDNKCNACEKELIASRFVVVCENGHIDDFPYFEWIHQGTARIEADEHVMSIETTGVSAALKDIIVKCSCGKSSTMQGAFGKEALKKVKPCAGNRPWLGDKQDCTLTPRTLQRGASNVYFSVTPSALSIPPWSEGAFKVINKHWKVLKHIPDTALPSTIAGMNMGQGTAYTNDDLVLAVRQRKAQETGEEIPVNSKGLRDDEYEALVMGKSEVSRDQDFVCIPAPQQSSGVMGWFDKVMLVKRLREIRVLWKFTRFAPPSPDDGPDRLAPLSKEPLGWLPAIEVLGEGVFLRLNETRLSVWESRPDVNARAACINDNYAERFTKFGTTPDKVISPRYLLIHTLAHMLINQWALDAGYPAASLRERLYVSDKMCGLLIYTATTDAAGSLGGVVAQADAYRLNDSLNEAIDRTSWCSADPLCIEADAAGVDSLNLAACHACVLLPETSCELSNTLLDRGLLIGTPSNPGLGFFSAKIQEI